MSKRRVVFLCCDGLGRDWIGPETTPFLNELKGKSLWCARHGAVFPSVTRVSAASITTGCHPARHGLHGNRMGLFEGGKIVVRDAGAPDFRGHMRRATGKTLLVPALAERVAKHGGFIAFSNVSPGAAFFLDPDEHGHVYHRSGSHGPGGKKLPAMQVSHDAAGDWAMTKRFCWEVLGERKPAVAATWLCDPDHTLHGVPLGSPAHLEALAAVDRCVREIATTVERLRAESEEILFVIGSDHGHETIGAAVDIEAWLTDQGLGELLAEGDIAVAGQGTSALFYAQGDGVSALIDVFDAMRREPWAGNVLVASALGRHYFPSGYESGIVAAVDMAHQPDANPYGVPGRRYVVAEDGKPVPIGSGQHGGLGPDETRPFLMINDGRVGARERLSDLTDIAPTIVSFLGLPLDGFDGRPI